MRCFSDRYLIKKKDLKIQKKNFFFSLCFTFQLDFPLVRFAHAHIHVADTPYLFQNLFMFKFQFHHISDSNMTSFTFFLFFSTICAISYTEARFRIPFRSSDIRQRPLSLEPSTHIRATLHRSMENIDLQQHRQRVSSFSSSESIQRSGSSLSINADNSPAIMRESISHRQAASMLNIAHPNRAIRRKIPQFILNNRKEIKLAGNILEKTGIALAATGGVLQIKDAISSDSHIGDVNIVSSSEKKNIDDTATEKNIAEKVTESTTFSGNTSTATEKNIPIGRDK